MKILITMAMLISIDTLSAQDEIAEEDELFDEMNSLQSDTLIITETYEETIPRYPGGEIQFFRYLSENLQYPIDAKNLGIEGNVTVSFEVQKDGRVNKNSVNVISSPSKLLNKEAIRLIMNSPNWISATRSKEGDAPLPIDYEITFPVPFRIK